MVIDVVDLAVQRGRREVLSGVDLACDGGELVAVVGPNGAGKSTLLAALAGDLRPKQGHVRIAGVDVGRARPGVVARTRAVLPQRSAVPFAFTGREVVALGRLAFAPEAASETDAHVDRALSLTGAEHLADRAYPRLSGGQQQRLQLARVLAQRMGAPDPGALLLDEPVAALDPAHQHRTLQLARHWAHEGDAVITVLHDLSLAARYADRVVVIEAGRKVADGPPMKVLHPALVADVFGLRVVKLEPPTAPVPALVAVGPCDGVQFDSGKSV